MNLYMTALSNIHTPPSTPTSRSPKPPRRADRWTARAQAECFWRGWVADIDSMSTVLGERGGQRRFSYKANSGPISSHILSGDLCFFFFFSSFFFTFSPFPFPPTLCVAFVHSFIFILLKAKKKRKKRKKNKVDKGCPPSSQQREEGGYR